ncbi:sigma-70 family RNA polymerase sigma factor [Alkalihalobacillus sp. AL-G]|uniref:sigma-70 family RNA polymerase sigma factor n=1 Tax=Alkalihalobacillus sp. AL-G TaxID=2926399 RepID=UPI002729B7F6|nr:sigma-70 family RNA polymerase sigma factor [Alkalihalobacillus sp. AL-G]WLD93648.1 sigma-70 family RNA polymerase sigma factor [Alkalihalobacillus sp. AL-G]
MEEYKPKKQSSVQIDNIIGRYPKDEVIEHLMDQYGEKLIRLAYTYVKDWGKAEDIVQEVFVTCYTKLDTFRGESSVKTWVYRITINRCHDHLRSWSFRNLHFTDKISKWIKGEKSTLEQELIARDEKEKLASQILTLPIKYREVMLLYYFEELTVQDISLMLLLNDSTVKTRLHRGRQLLKEIITSERSSDDGRTS